MTVILEVLPVSGWVFSGPCVPPSLFLLDHEIVIYHASFGWTTSQGRAGKKSSHSFERYPAKVVCAELNNTDKHRVITVSPTTIAGMELTGLFGRSTLKRGVPLHPNAKVGHVLPLPEGGVPILAGFEGGRPQVEIQHEVGVDVNLTPGVLFGNGSDAVKRLPVIRALHSMTNEVSRIIESFAGEF